MLTIKDFQLITIYLISVSVIPSLVFVLTSQPSYALGMMVLSLGVIFSSLNYRISIPHFKFILFCLVLLIFHSLTVFFVFGTLHLLRLLGTTLAILFMIITAHFKVQKLNSFSESSFRRAMKLVFVLFLFVGFLSTFFDFSYPFLTKYNEFSKPVFPYMEPSHYAIFFAPFLLYTLLETKNSFRVILSIIIVLFLIFSVENLTLLIVLALSMVVALPKKYFIIICISMGLSGFFIDLPLDYYTSRMQITNADNLSTLVWIQGWQEAFINIRKTNGLGVGLSQFGIAEPSSDAAQLIFEFTGDFLNRYDGGTFGAKIIGELGILGIILFLFVIVVITKSVLILKKNEKIRSQQLFYYSCIVVFLVELFFRSTSYLAPGFFLFIVGLIGIRNKSKS